MKGLIGLKMMVISMVMALMWVGCNGHAYILSPSPRHAGDDLLKEYPCGVGFKDKFGLDVTTVSPGKVLVQFRETIVHAGAPYRLALTTGGSDNSYDNYVLLDHIPHCDGCGAGLYSVEVAIPNWRCTDCALQLIQIMTDKFPASTSCANPQGLASSCGSQDHAYFSCANIHITGTEDDRIPFYVSYSGRRGFANRFPYSPGEKNDTAWVLQSTGEWKLLFEAPTGPTASEVPGTNRFYQGLAVWIVVFLIVIASFVVFMVLRHYAKSHAGTSYDNAQADLTQSTEDSEVVVTEPEEENGVKSPSTASTASTPSSNPFGDDSEAVEL